MRHSMSEDREHDLISTYEVREVVAEFHDVDAFEDAVERVERAGIDRSAINMIASHDAVERKLDNHYEPMREIEEDGRVPQTIYADRHEIAEGKAIAVGLPVYVCGAGAGLAVVATGGTLAVAALIAAAGAAAGAGIGSLVARAIGRGHAEKMEDQLRKGTLLLWVHVRDAEEARVIDILKEAGGENVHAHTLTRYHAYDDIPFHDFNPDPFLEHDPSH